MLENTNTYKYKDKRNDDCQRRINVLLEQLPSFCTDYELYARQKNSIKTRMEYLQDINTFFNYLQKKNPLIKNIANDVTTDILQRLNGFDFDDYSAWLSEYTLNNKQNTNSNVTKRRKLASIKSLFHFLYVRGYINCNPTEKIIMPTVHKKKRGNIRILEDDECTLLLKTVDKAYKDALEKLRQSNLTPVDRIRPYLVMRDKAIIYLFLGTGLRVSELCAIDCSNINFSLGYINVIRKEDSDDSDESDRVYLSDQVLHEISEYLNYARDNIGAAQDNYDALFLSSQKTRITPRGVELMIKGYANKALGTGNGITPHKLRATFGTRYQRKFGDITATQTVMNHSDISVTARYYLQEDKEAREQVKKMKI